MFTIIMINIWIGVPYQMLISTGVLMNIPADMIEAARIDGARTRFRCSSASSCPTAQRAGTVARHGLCQERQQLQALFTC